MSSIRPILFINNKQCVSLVQLCCLVAIICIDFSTLLMKCSFPTLGVCLDAAAAAICNPCFPLAPWALAIHACAKADSFLGQQCLDYSLNEDTGFPSITFPRSVGLIIFLPIGHVYMT